MGNTQSTDAADKPEAAEEAQAQAQAGAMDVGQIIGKIRDIPRAAAITEGQKRKPGARPPGSARVDQQDYDVIQECLRKMLLFDKLEADVQRKIVMEMYERSIKAGDILIQEGDVGIAASELYVVKEGEFEVLERRQGLNFRVNMKARGDTFGEVSLMYNVPRSATVAATRDSVVWVLERDQFRHFVRDHQKAEVTQVELFLNQVKLLVNLSQDEKMRLLDALEEVTYTPGTPVIKQGEAGDLFYIIKAGEAVVYQDADGGPKKVNHLFKADYFGEQALLTSAPRGATVEALTELTCLTLARDRFTELLGPLQDIMKRDKSPEVVTSKLVKLGAKSSQAGAPAEVIIRRRRRSRSASGTPTESWEMVRARGHHDEVLNLVGSGSQTNAQGLLTMTLTEGPVLGGGAFSRVSIVTEEASQRTYALKRMRKSSVVQCPEHVFCEQSITSNTAHPFCIRQYGSFQDKYHLYFLFDLMTGGDLMDVLVAEAKVIKRRIPQGTWKRGPFSPKVKMLKGMEEPLAKYYIASLVLALEYLHEAGIVYRDLKPENVFIDSGGFVKLGDFGFAKILEGANRTYTFCGTPGYVAPENVLAHGYNVSVDWWGLGVLAYVLLTGRQPFSSPKTDDPMVVMRRIVDDNWHIKYPPYLSAAAKDLIGRLLERKPGRRLGMLSGRAGDIKRHRWFEGMEWDAMAARRVQPPRIPQDDAAKRMRELADGERKQKPPPKESSEELAECEEIFATF
jgi:cGMP-dependent protein kinase 2